MKYAVHENKKPKRMYFKFGDTTAVDDITDNIRLSKFEPPGIFLLHSAVILFYLIFLRYDNWKAFHRWPIKHVLENVSKINART